MEAEEPIRNKPCDGVVLMGGRDRTAPALLVGASSTGLSCTFLPAGPMLRGPWRGKMLGSGSEALETPRGTPRRDHHARAVEGDERRHEPLLRHLRDRRHRRDQDADGRGVGPGAAGLGRRLDLLVEEAEPERRRAASTPPPQHDARGWTALHLAHVRHADEGRDFDVPERGAPTPGPGLH
jgi:dihydroxyacid dehydratase/phosphogluconate dehydratase